MELNNTNRFDFDDSKGEVVDSAEQLLKRIERLGMRRLQIETDVGTVYLGLNREEPRKDEYDF